MGVGGATTVTVGPLTGSGALPWLSARNSTGHVPAGSDLAPTYVPLVLVPELRVMSMLHPDATAKTRLATWPWLLE